MSNKRVVIYCRESRDERKENYERIETQRDILLDFCKKNSIGDVIKVIMDDDVSGTSFKRFYSVLDMAEKREFDIIVFKDSSRLGRNLRESLNFMEELKTYGVEVVFESEEYNEDFFPLLAWFNEQRAKEDSRKIRRVMRHKMENGELLIRPVYGYKRGEGGSLIPDDICADVVRSIYSMFCNGMSISEIAERLNEKGVPTPSQIKLMSNACLYWNSQHIRRILLNDCYIGTMTYSKRSTVSFKDKRIVENPESEWVVIKNHHEPIIDTELFKKSYELLNKKNSAQTRKKRGVHIFSGVLHCGTLKKCGSGCFTHRCGEEKLSEVILAFIKDLLYRNIEYIDFSPDVLKQKARLTEKTASIKKIIEQIYSDRLEGLIDEELFLKKYSFYAGKLKETENELSLIKKQTDGADLKSFIDNIGCESITADIVNICINCADVYLPDEFSKAVQVKNRLSENFKMLDKYGGIVMNMKFKTAPQSSFASRWL